jgi:hypothetical protein
MSVYYDRIKKSLQEVLNRISEDQNAPSDQSSPRITRLYTYFSELLVARDETFSKFNELFQERTTLYGSLLPALFLNLLNNRVQISGMISNYMFEFVRLISSEEFVGYVVKALSFNNNPDNGDDELVISSYFSRSFSGIMDLVYPDVEYAFSNNILEIVLDPTKTINISNLEDQQFIDKSIFLIAYMSDVSNYGFNNFLNQNSTFLNGDGENSMISKSIEVINLNLEMMETAFNTIQYINDTMKTKDSSYREEYIIDIIGLYQELSQIILNFSDMSSKLIKSLLEIGEVTRFAATIAEIDSKCKFLITDIIDSIKVAEEFLEDNSLFIATDKDYSDLLKESIGFFEGITFENELEIDLINPFVEFKEYPISEWINDIVGTKVLDSDIYNLLAIVVGTMLAREKFTETVGLELKEFALMNMIRKNYIDELEATPLNSQFIEKRNLERNLAEIEQLKVIQNFQEDIIPFFYKLYLPKLEVLDYMTFQEISQMGQVSETTFRENVKILIFEAFAKEKQNFQITIRRIIESISSQKPETLKALYMELCFRDVVASFTTYLNGTANGSVDQDTVNVMLDFVSRDEAASNNPRQNILDLIDDYIDVWNYFYNSSSGLVENALKDGDLKNLLT